MIVIICNVFALLIAGRKSIAFQTQCSLDDLINLHFSTIKICTHTSLNLRLNRPAFYYNGWLKYFIEQLLLFVELLNIDPRNNQTSV